MKLSSIQRGLLVVTIACGLGACSTLERPAKPDFTGYTGESEFVSDSGEQVETTFSWTATVSQDLTTPNRRRTEYEQPNYVWCVTPTSGSNPSGSNTCYDFDAVECVLNNPQALQSKWVCTGTVTLPAALAGRQSDWYVRAENPKDRKRYRNSEPRTFTWTVLRPDLRIQDMSIFTAGAGGAQIGVGANVANYGDADAQNVTVRIAITLTDANDNTISVELPINEQIVNEVEAASTVDPGLAAVGVSLQRADLPLESPFVLHVVFTIDPNNTVVESDETNNSGSDMRTIF